MKAPWAFRAELLRPPGVAVESWVRIRHRLLADPRDPRSPATGSNGGGITIGEHVLFGARVGVSA
jgi:hypothetical protein